MQRSYAHYAQSGQWNEMASLFTTDAKLIRGTETTAGRAAIGDWLQVVNGGRRGSAVGRPQHPQRDR